MNSTNELFERKEIDGINYSVIVATKFGSTLSTYSGDKIVHSGPLLKSAIEGINCTRGIPIRRKQSTKKRRS